MNTAFVKKYFSEYSRCACSSSMNIPTLVNHAKTGLWSEEKKWKAVFVAPALAGRHRRASFRPFVRSSVRPSIRQHLTWVSCERNSSYSFAPIVLKLCMCFPHGMRICMWIGHNCWINFCHFFDIVNLVIFHPDCIDSGYLL